MKMTVTEGLELLAWIASQSKLKIETWNVSTDDGFKERVSLWTLYDDEDEPIHAHTVIEALVAAKKRHDT